jgi:hypothetical protein
LSLREKVGARRTARARSGRKPRRLREGRRTVAGRGGRRAHRRSEAGAREQALDLLQRSADASELERVTQRQGIFVSDRDAVEGPLHLAREAYFLDHGGDE